LKIKFNKTFQFSLSAILIILFLFYTNGFETILQVNNFEFSNNTQLQASKNLRAYHFEKIVEIEKDVIFNLMLNTKNYPIIFPEKISNIEIIDDRKFSTISAMTFHVLGLDFPTQIQIKSFENSIQVIKFLDGPARDSKITLSFSEFDSKTKIDAEIFIKFKNPLNSLTSNLSENDFREKFNQGIEAFVDYNNT